MKTATESRRRAALVASTLQEVGEAGSLDVTVARIARRAGVSSALAHHYFGSKESLLCAAMRAVLVAFGAEARAGLAAARDPEQRLAAILRACLSPPNFAPATASAWLNLYVLAQTSPEARRLLAVYHRRLDSNLRHALRPVLGERAAPVAAEIGALIDGWWLRRALRREAGPGAEDALAAARALVVARAG